MKYSRIGMVIALREEFICFQDKLGEFVGEDTIGSFSFLRYRRGEMDIVVVDAGVGELTAAAATQLLITVYGVQVIVNCGVVGSLNNNLDIGELSLVTGVVHTQRDTSQIDGVEVGRYPEFPELLIHTSSELNAIITRLNPDIRCTILASSDVFVGDSATKNHLRTTFGADICDMEGAGIAVLATKNSTPFVMLKVVSDKADETSQSIFSRGQVTQCVVAYIEVVASLLDALSVQ